MHRRLLRQVGLDMCGEANGAQSLLGTGIASPTSCPL
jgi:hypothetical protein